MATRAITAELNHMLEFIQQQRNSIGEEFDRIIDNHISKLEQQKRLRTEFNDWQGTAGAEAYREDREINSEEVLLNFGEAVRKIDEMTAHDVDTQVGNINFSAMLRNIKNVTRNNLTEKLMFEVNIPGLLALSSIILLPSGLLPYALRLFSVLPADPRTTMLTRYNYSEASFPQDTVNWLRGLLASVVNRERSRQKAIDELMQRRQQFRANQGKVIKYFINAIETLPSDMGTTAEVNKLNTKIATRHLITIFRTLFEEHTDDGASITVDFEALHDKNYKKDPAKHISKPAEGFISRSGRAVGLIALGSFQSPELRTRGVNIEFYRLGVQCKNTIDKHNLRCTMAFQVVDTDITFFLIERINNLYIMTELSFIRFPLLLSDLPEFTVYIDKLLQVLATFTNKCITNNLVEDDVAAETLNENVLAAIVTYNSSRKRKLRD